MSDESPIIELRDVTFGYPPDGAASPVLQRVDLTVTPDDFLGVIGPNGGGKTTLLKIMLGLLRPQRGSVRVFGKDPCRVRRWIGYVPQHTEIDLAAPATVLDLALMGRLSRSGWGFRFGKAHRDAALAALEQTSTADLAHRRIADLSGGQRQRVLVARALAADAKLLLLDEPTAGVDSHMERDLTNLLHELNARLPIVMVSHDISFVSAHLKRVACLNKTLVCHPADQITSEVITDMYEGEVKLVRHDENCALAEQGCDHEHEPGHPHHPPPHTEHRH